MADKDIPKETDIHSAPDPEEDDLDDLDDVLDKFQSKPSIPDQKLPSTTAPSASGPGRPTEGDNNDVDEDLAKQLQAGMANLMSELDSNPDMQKQFEQMMQELISAGAAASDQEAGEHLKAAATATPKTPEQQKSQSSKSKADPFGDSIRRTMERMQQSEDAATAASAAGNSQSEDDLLAQMMRELQNGGEGGEEDFNKMLMNMMTQLTNKEILYEPMKELHDKFPAWLEKNSATTPKEDLDRYKEQRTLVTEIVQRFERKGYSDDNEDDRDYIVDRMQRMQAAGSPPADLVGDMSAAQEALGELDSGCPTQ